MKTGAVALLLACIAACTSPVPPGGTQERERLAIATDATFPPFHYLDGGGVPTGFDIELARVMGERAGFRSDVAVVPYDGLHAGLERDAYDLVAATTGITAERAERYLFTESYFETCQAALVRAGNGETSVENLVGRRVGASGSGTASLAMQSIAGADHVPLAVEGVGPLEDGTVDAIIVDEFDAVEMARQSEGRLVVLATPIAIERYAFVLAGGRYDLKRVLNDALAALQADGTVADLRRRFGVERDADWPVVTQAGRSR